MWDHVLCHSHVKKALTAQASDILQMALTPGGRVGDGLPKGGNIWG